MDWNIPLFKIYWDEADTEIVSKTIRRGMFWAIGPNIEKLESGLADYLGVKYVVAVNSGTSALHAALLASGIGPGDEVIVPSFTFISTANAAMFVGAEPVFADIEETTLGLDPEDVRKKITSRTKAIIPVHYAGSPCMIYELVSIAEEHNLVLIEDAAESLGATVDDKQAGSFGISSILSFCANKVISTGEGGAVATNSEDVYEKLKLVRSHGRNESSNYFTTATSMDYITLGYNYRMSDITAALGVAQLQKIDQLIKMRRENADRYMDKLSGISQIELPKIPQGFSHVFQMFTVRVLDGEKTRDALSRHLSEKGIMTKVYFSPVHQAHYYKHELLYDCTLPVTEKISQQVLTLPMYPELTLPEIEYIAREITRFFS
ncbi:MAG: DegT/DnrJ/EryC1/StrS family aminotransferase [Dehalococcoidales bacterium]|nr:DegT/DnrJ/EryC1/StrS family aminotransferase [Dehalococcoidales bacterium]